MIQKTIIQSDLPRLPTQRNYKFDFLIFLMKDSIGNIWLVENVSTAENQSVRAGHQIPGCPRNPESAFRLVSSAYSNTCFSVSTDLIFSIKVSIKSFTMVENDSTEQSFCLIFAS